MVTPTLVLAVRSRVAGRLRPNLVFDWRVLVVAALIGGAVLVSTPPAVTRGAVVADLDAVGRHPDFRWPPALLEESQPEWPPPAGMLPVVDR
jgi:hypothetical protein